MTRPHYARLDPAMQFIFSKLMAENATLPADKQMGLKAYCRKHGFLTDVQMAVVQQHEIPFTDLEGTEALRVHILTDDWSAVS